MTTLSQIRTGKIVELLPIDTLFPILVSFHFLVLPFAGPPSENLSLIKTTPCPMKQSLPISTNSHIKE